ncbi:MAG: EamA family transporter RarD [Rhizobiaceae bacterium]
MAAEPVAAPGPVGDDTRAGLVYALAAYALWGMLPLYMKALAHVPAYEVVLHRAIWSVPVAGILLLLLRRTADIRAALRSPRTLAMAAVTAGLISVNWGIYVWAISVDRATETALGYYINPLVNVLLAALFLGERLGRLQWVSVALATMAVLILTMEAGHLPWISLVLALTFGIYGFLRKTLPIGPSQGFFLEVIILAIPATAVAVWLGVAGTGHFRFSQGATLWLLVGCGPATALPLILYAYGTKALRYTTIGLLFYITPTMIFLIALLVFDEPFNVVKGLAFVLIWVALAIYTWAMFAEKGRPARE